MAAIAVAALAFLSASLAPEILQEAMMFQKSFGKDKGPNLHGFTSHETSWGSRRFHRMQMGAEFAQRGIVRLISQKENCLLLIILKQKSSKFQLIFHCFILFNFFALNGK